MSGNKTFVEHMQVANKCMKVYPNHIYNAESN